MKELSKVTAIFRNYSNEELECVMETLKESEIRSVELAISQGEQSFQQLDWLIKKYQGEFLIGAGTITTLPLLEKAISFGATFALSPTLMTEEMIRLCEKEDVLSVPGAFSPTEILQAQQQGADIIKVFPIANLGESFAENIKGPLPDLKVMAVGGVSLDNMQNYFEHGIDYAGIGSSLFPKKAVKALDYEALKSSLASRTIN